MNSGEMFTGSPQEIVEHLTGQASLKRESESGFLLLFSINRSPRWGLDQGLLRIVTLPPR